ncbi:ABC transporter substrate-binding protein [Treponema sp.]|uniref:ABC transporter substrate-binding protein n=1 Tax=Treponema sp. TaxID=166 RepID=UPI00388D850D
MKKSLTLLACIMTAALVLSCTKTESAANTKKETHVVVDHNGRDVVLPVNIERVVMISPMPLPSIYCLFMGGTDKLVGMHPSSMAAAQNSYLKTVYPDVVNIPTDFVRNGSVNAEELLKLKPDVVFYLASDKALEELLMNAGITSFAFSTSISPTSSTIETYSKWIEKFGEIFGDTGRAEAIIKYGQEVEKKVSERVARIDEKDKKSVLMLYMYDDTQMQTSGVNFYGDYWINAAGGINVAKDLTGPNAISMEQVYTWNPDAIFVTNFSPRLPEDFYNNSISGTDWSVVKAVREKNVHKFPLGMYRWFPPSSDTPLCLQWLAKTLYPDVFSDIDMDAEIKSYFKKFYGVELTDENLNDIYHPSRAASGK